MTCAHCTTEFTPKKVNAKFCSPKCQKQSYQQRRRDKVLEWVSLQKDKPCMDCGGNFPPECMDFDHRPGEVKLFTIGHARITSRIERLIPEVSKCDVVCANCHRIRTKKRAQYSA